jgi:putative flavoprotein involved in K+ transport
MPEMHFDIRWPDGKTEHCYSPSRVIEEYLAVGESYGVNDFVERVRTALTIASERVRAKYGFACSSAIDQLRAIEEAGAALPGALREGRVAVLAFTRHAPPDARGGSKVGAAPKPEHHQVIVVGGGQAGLSVSYTLKQRGIEHVVLEAKRIAHSWREKRWDSFCLVTPNWQCTLPGYPYAGADPQGFMLKDEIVEYVEGYARAYALPVREGVSVESLRAHVPSPASPGRFALRTSAGEMTADQVVVATGSYHVPVIPALAGGFPKRVRHLHSADYKNPQALPDGAVLVVGTGQSGCQIAEDLHLAGRDVHLAVGPAPRCARVYRGKDVTEWLNLMGYYDLPYDRHPDRDQVRDKTNHYVTGRDGGRDIDLRKFALEGMHLYGPLKGASGSRALFAPELVQNLDAADEVYRSINRRIDAFIDKNGIHAPAEAPYAPVWEPSEEPLELDLEAANVSVVLWSVGFRSDFAWIHFPVCDERGHVRHERGVTDVEGLYFIGLPWLYSWGSGRFSGVGRDAAHLGEAIAVLSGTCARRAPGVVEANLSS